MGSTGPPCALQVRVSPKTDRTKVVKYQIKSNQINQIKSKTEGISHMLVNCCLASPASGSTNSEIGRIKANHRRWPKEINETITDGAVSFYVRVL